MKFKDVRDAYEALSAKASDIVRQMSLAGVALVWIFKSGDSATPVLETQLLRAAFFIFLALFCDFLQYLVGTITWHSYFRIRERAGTSLDDEVIAPTRINLGTWILFYSKAGSIVVAYCVYIIPFLWHKFAG